MKLNFVAIVLFQLIGQVNSSAAKICKELCTGIRQGLLSASHTCSPSLTVNPSPDVYKSCQHGKRAAFDKACVSLCSDEEIVVASLASEACRSTKGRGPADYWCRRGFSSVLKKLETHPFPVSESIIDDEISKELDEEVVSSEEVIPQVDQVEVEANSRENNTPAIDNEEILSIEEPELESPHEEEPEDKIIEEEDPEDGIIEEEPEELEVVQAQEFVSEEEDNNVHNEEVEEVDEEDVEYVEVNEF
mmetsp:Transcript_24436/g.38350  ORF Transcript_24436/g.38350 Transcript_24436/m.38350 type:complete len:247 (+) Transcript_24436:91-831(+)